MWYRLDKPCPFNRAFHWASRSSLAPPRAVESSSSCSHMKSSVLRKWRDTNALHPFILVVLPSCWFGVQQQWQLRSEVRVIITVNLTVRNAGECERSGHVIHLSPSHRPSEHMEVEEQAVVLLLRYCSVSLCLSAPVLPMECTWCKVVGSIPHCSETMPCDVIPSNASHSFWIVYDSCFSKGAFGEPEEKCCDQTLGHRRTSLR